MNNARFHMAALLLLAAVAGAAEPFHVGHDDTQESVRAKVRALAEERLGPGYGMVEVTRFYQEIEDNFIRLENQVAEATDNATHDAPRVSGFSLRSASDDLSETLRLAGLIATVRNETSLLLLEVIQDYDVRIGRVTELARDLQVTLREIEELHARSQQLANRAFASVEIAQQASESLVDVLATYHQVIETQSSLLRERLFPAERRGFAVSVLPGLVWDDAAAVGTVSGGMGFLLTFPSVWNLAIGAGFMTTLPAGGSMIFAQIGYSP